jgi:hypothetical protein
VPEEGRGIFKGGKDISNSDIEDFDNHDELMEAAGKKVIKVTMANRIPKWELDNFKVIENHKDFVKCFKNDKWACCSTTSFRWQHD